VQPGDRRSVDRVPPVPSARIVPGQLHTQALRRSLPARWSRRFTAASVSRGSS
jgi:hypothetical protein